MPIRTRLPTEKGVTLIELLTVIVIVAMLSALITSAVLGGIAYAKNAKCASNLSSIHKAIELYAADHEGLLPPYTFIAHRTAKAEPERFKAALHSYGAIDDLFYCPLDPRAKTDFRGEWHSFKHTSYTTGPEVWFNGRTDTAGAWLFQLSSISKPSEFMLLLDQTILEKNPDGRWKRYGAHGKRLNVLYADGHTKSVPMFPP